MRNCKDHIVFHGRSNKFWDASRRDEMFIDTTFFKVQSSVGAQ